MLTASLGLEGSLEPISGRFLELVPFAEPPVMDKSLGVHHDDGVWFFLGSNPRATSETEPITGRPEHKDDVQHSGTWHMQLAGEKTWWIRPADAEVWGRDPPELSECTASIKLKDGKHRLCIIAEA